MGTFGQRLKELRNDRGISQNELSKYIGVSKSSVNMYERDEREPGFETLEAIADFFNVNMDYLLGREPDCKKPPARPLPSNLIPLQPMKKIPVVGQIACGTPILAEQNITDYIDLPQHIYADYALICKGNGMVNIGIQDGDTVYIRQQNEVENGQIAAVMVGDDEATLKRFYFNGSAVQLIAENPSIAPLLFSGAEMERVRVVGRAVAYTHTID